MNQARSYLEEVIKSLFQVFGLRIGKLDEPRNWRDLFIKLQKGSIEISTVFDIGAHHGNWSLEAVKYLRNSKFHLFDINPYLASRVLNESMYFHQALLSNSKKEVDFYEIGGTGDSYLKENTTYYENNIPRRLMTTTINDLLNLEKPSIQLPQFIKLDTQGSELDILEGATLIYEELKIAVMEIPVTEYNIGSPTFSEYIEFMMRIGFAPVDFVEVHKFAGKLIQVDVVFVKEKLLPKWIEK
jgi:FkbM family methyltransferase